MMDASICGLGQAAPNPIQLRREVFPHESRVAAAPHGERRPTAGGEPFENALLSSS